MIDQAHELQSLYLTDTIRRLWNSDYYQAGIVITWNPGKENAGESGLDDGALKRLSSFEYKNPLNNLG